MQQVYTAFEMPTHGYYMLCVVMLPGLVATDGFIRYYMLYALCCFLACCYRWFDQKTCPCQDGKVSPGELSLPTSWHAPFTSSSSLSSPPLPLLFPPVSPSSLNCHTNTAPQRLLGLKRIGPQIHDAVLSGGERRGTNEKSPREIWPHRETAGSVKNVLVVECSWTEAVKVCLVRSPRSREEPGNEASYACSLSWKIIYRLSSQHQNPSCYLVDLFNFQKMAIIYLFFLFLLLTHTHTQADMSHEKPVWWTEMSSSVCVAGISKASPTTARWAHESPWHGDHWCPGQRHQLFWGRHDAREPRLQVDQSG